MTSPKDIEQQQPAYGELPAGVDADLMGSLAAIRRTAQKAREVAQQTGTDLIVVRGGRLIRVGPQENPHP